MEIRPFGRTALRVPVIGMGTWQTFDVRPVDEPRRREVTDAAIATGATFFDSSPMYGRAEAVLGRTIGERRAQVLVATKVWTSSDSEAEAQIAHSLSCYSGLVDIYQVHNLVAWPKRLATLDRMKAEGVVRAVGVTHYSAQAFAELRRAMNDPRVDVI